MKTKFVSFFVGLLVSLSVMAQSGGGGYFLSGAVYFPQIPQMTANINGVDNTLPQYMGMMGGGGFAIIKGLVIGGRGVGGAFTKKMNVNGVKAEYSFGGGEFNLGRVILHRKSLLSFLYMGIGGYDYGVELENSTAGDVDLGSVTIPAGAKVNFEYSSFTLTGGLAIKYTRVKGFDLGLDVSYVYPFGQNYQAVMIGITLGGLGTTPPKEKNK